MPDQPTAQPSFLLLDALPLPAYVSDANGAALFVNRALTLHSGVSTEELLGYGFAELIHPDDREHALTLWAREWHDGKPTQHELRLRTKNGTYHWHCVQSQPTFDRERLAYIVGTLHDIHALKDAEARVTLLHLVTARLSHAQDVPDVLKVLPDCARALHAPCATITLLKDDGLHLVGAFGYPEACLGVFRVLPHDADVPAADVLLTGQPLILPFEAFAARYPHLVSPQPPPARTLVLIPLRADGHVRGVLTVGYLEQHDVSEAERTFLLTLADVLAGTLHRVQLDVTSLETEVEHYRAVFEQAAVGVARVAFEGARFLEVNDALCRITGYLRDELLTTPWTEITHPDDVDLDLVPFRRMAAGELETYTVEKRFMHKHGHTVWTRLTLSLVRDARGRPNYEICVVEDISESKATEAQLRASEALLSAMLDALPVGVTIADATGRLLRDNTAHRELWGVPPETTRWEQYGDWVGWNPDTGDRLSAADWAMTRALLHGEIVRSELVEFQPFGDTRPPGERATLHERRYYLNNAAPIRDAEGTIIGGVVAEQDVTKQIRAERTVQENAERVQLALSAGAILGTWFWDLPSDRFTVDEGFAVNFGLDSALGREGLSLEQVIATVHPDDRPELIAAIDAAITRGGPYAHQYRVRRHDGRYYWIEANGRVDKAADGSPLSFPGVLLDAEERRAALAALRESEQRYRLAVHATNDTIWDWDLSCGHILWNEAVQFRFGYSSHEVGSSGAWWKANIHPDDRERVVAGIQAVIGGAGETWSDEYRFRRADGSYAEVHDRGAVLRDAQDRAVRMIGAMQDLTERQAAESALRESEDRLRIATEAAAIGTWDYDLLRDVLRWDTRTKALFGLSPEAEVTFETAFLAGLHPEDRSRVEAAVATALEVGGPGEYDIEYRTIGLEDGVERWIAAKGRVFFEDDRALRFIGTVIDITERKRTEARLREVTEALEWRVQERTADLMRTNAELERSNTELERFAYITSHDLIEPIRTVSSFTGLLKQRYGATLDERGQLFLDMTLKGTERMKALVDDLLTYSRISGDRVPLRSVDVRAPLSEALARLERRLTETQAHVTWGELGVVLGDGPQLAQLFQNLLGNAVKFSRAGVTPEVRVNAVRDGEWWQFSVSDNGIGIDEQYLDQIFELFRRLHTREKFEGTGLGLGICQKIVERHGGRLWATSKVGVGSTFHFTLRAAGDA
ncbi:PAS domain S-box protein [Deinococcus peraridilitoris]|uniref:histidine kinase n=1 Tax=Deinococcus peraridilitoris (strain DSM 19664 / LMG 22246 / CIP 109416 / KR-200) TaxID=937777 RepID=L0A970_DEIPD|nr:PAS domain S-box protein [Deinococcus peraridilitoris]AFZ69590.1 PAS domain S-box [Deinococcus peraridilitoris DSM 19664]